jgi:hypothetical protein
MKAMLGMADGVLCPPSDQYFKHFYQFTRGLRLYNQSPHRNPT